jgi:p-hydroxybenzoate 3-monooxygenase
VTTEHRTEVAIVGAGPAGLMLAHLLDLEGIESVVLEEKSREYCLARVRAGVLEADVADLIREVGVGERMAHDGLVHDGIELQVDGRRHRVDFAGLTGRHVVVYGQQELVRDLIEHRTAAGGDVRFEAEDVRVHDHRSDAPSIGYRWEGRPHRLHCRVVAGCDGFHGVCRETMSDATRREWSATHPYAWLGILAEAAPAIDDLIYCSAPAGFALYSLRSPRISRLYLQVGPDEDLEAWPEDRIWDELDRRFAIEADPAWSVTRGPVLEMGVTPMRSFVCEPMQEGRLFLAGDAAHIVPPTGAKGLNLAVHDVRRLAASLTRWLRRGDAGGLERYTAGCLARVWRAQDFSLFMTRLLHRPADPFEHRAQLARLRYVAGSEAAQRSLAENYVGLPDSRLGGP